MATGRRNTDRRAGDSPVSMPPVDPAPPPEGGGRPRPAAIGIDFGTSKCCVAAVRDGRVDVLENELGQRTTPSCVAFNSQQRLVGSDALDQAVVNCANTVHSVKSFLGRTYDEVKDCYSPCHIRPTHRGHRFEYVVHYKNHDQRLRPEQVAAMLLGRMKDIAESSLGCSVDRAVISVPASFGNAQRLAVKYAAQVAGLEVLELINETTAAGVAFADNRTVKTPAVIAVVDFGAGKLDVSIMEVRDGSVRVVVAAGNTNLGGCNLDDALVGHCVGVIHGRHNYRVKEKKQLERLRIACEKAKKTLTLLPEAQFILENLFCNVDVSLTVKRKDLDLLIKSDIRREVSSLFDHLLRQVSLAKDVISKVVLVGGATRMPLVRAVLEEYFGPGKLDQTVNQDEAVAQGAALRAATLSGQESGTSIGVQDVTAFATIGDYSTKGLVDLYERIPLSRKINITSSNSHYMRNLYERCYTGGNKKTFHVHYSRSQEFFSLADCGFLVVNADASGILEVQAEVNGKILDGLVMCTNYYPPGVLKEWIDVANKFRKDVENEKNRVDAETQLESLVYEVKAALCDVQELVSRGEISETTHLCDVTLEWIEDAQAASLQDFNAQIEKLTQVREKLDRIKLLAVEPKKEIGNSQNELLDKSKKFVEAKSKESSVNVQNHGLDSTLSHLSKNQFEEAPNSGDSDNKKANRTDNQFYGADELDQKQVTDLSTNDLCHKMDQTTDDLHHETDTVTDDLHHEMDTVTNDLHHETDTVTDDLHHETDTVTDDLHHETDTVTGDLHRKTGTRTRGHHRRQLEEFLCSMKTEVLHPDEILGAVGTSSTSKHGSLWQIEGGLAQSFCNLSIDDNGDVEKMEVDSPPSIDNMKLSTPRDLSSESSRHVPENSGHIEHRFSNGVLRPQYQQVYKDSTPHREGSGISYSLRSQKSDLGPSRTNVSTLVHSYETRDALAAVEIQASKKN
ncbi:hypothetical protein HAZT_HAZT011221 [Hyalella azteca]|uniref:Uncharacterized protein n=1 Tax=Hyalella azteca TaxID=294128 RepID=A0A6A0H550_HYAAZ|nr:hypothetical protein HAZT_HAZT011221 [Hyalella azteca]